jgi:hypothetical protein
MAYKIVRGGFVDEKGASTIYKSLTRLTKETGQVIYEVGKPTRPTKGCGPLCAFDSIEAAKLFKHAHGWYSAPVFLCKIERDKKNTQPYTSFGLEPVVPLPPGTILCKKVTLTKRIF